MRKRLLTSHRRALLLQLLLALSLLLAQAAAQAHVYSHLASGAAKTDFNGTTGRLCSECLAAAPLLSAAGSPDSPHIAIVADLPGVIAFRAAPCVQPCPTHAFRSRAPPVLL